MHVEIGAEAALFPEKEYINGIFVAVHAWAQADLSINEKRLQKQPNMALSRVVFFKNVPEMALSGGCRTS
jgi:hypothetical protein